MSQPGVPRAPSEESVLRAIVEGVESETGESFFRSLVRNLAEALGVQYAFVSEVSEDRLRFRTLAVWGRGAFLDNVEVPLAGTPCEAVLNGETSHHQSALQACFPEDKGLVDWGAESYCGVPIVDRNGEPFGHFAILDDVPMPDASRAIAVMRIFAARTWAEIERARAHGALQASEERLARILDTAMDAIVTFDEERRVQLFNGTAEKVFRCTAGESVGTTLDRFLTDPFRSSLETAMQSNGAPYVWAPGGLLARRADGAEFAVEATISQVHVGGQRLFTLILRDVDERRRAEEELRSLHEQNEYLQEEIRAVHNVDEIVGQSPALRTVLEKCRLVAGTDSSVLLLGETGTGKEVIARLVHQSSQRSARPLIKVNCAAIPAGLVESELFGHERGAFTGATERRVGRFELADRGTIFLDEIGELPVETQSKLLRVLQERELERVGGSKTIKVDVRVIAATNRDLVKAVAAGTFREDLYYRLNVFPITLPPLRDRLDDIPALVHYFVGRFAAKTGHAITRVSKEAMARLAGYSWPGNIRELENVIERAVILSTGASLEITPDFLPARAAGDVSPSAAKAPEPRDGSSLDQVERRHILSVLKRVRWRIDGPDGAARILNLAPSTLRSRIKRLGIERSSEENS